MFILLKNIIGKIYDIETLKAEDVTHIIKWKFTNANFIFILLFHRKRNVVPFALHLQTRIKSSRLKKKKIKKDQRLYYKSCLPRNILLGKNGVSIDRKIKLLFPLIFSIKMHLKTINRYLYYEMLFLRCTFTKLFTSVLFILINIFNTNHTE